MMNKIMENMNKYFEGMNVMCLAHEIRRALNLEGDYHAQMSYALKKAHAIKAGVIRIEDVIDIVEKEAACTTAPKSNTNGTVVKLKTKVSVGDKNNVEDRMIDAYKITDRYYINHNVYRNYPGYTISYLKDGIAYALSSYSKEITFNEVRKVAIYLSKYIPEIVTANDKTIAAAILKHRCYCNEHMDMYCKGILGKKKEEPKPQPKPEQKVEKEIKIDANTSDEDLLKKFNYIMTIHAGIVFVTNRKGVTTCTNYNEKLGRNLTVQQTEVFIAKNISRFPKGGVVKHRHNFFGGTPGFHFIKVSE